MSTAHPSPQPIWCYFDRMKGSLETRLQTCADLVRAWGDGSTVLFQLVDSSGGEIGGCELTPSERLVSESTGALSYEPSLLVKCENAGTVAGFEVVGPAGTVLLCGQLDTELTVQEGDVGCIRFGAVTVVFP